MTFWLPVLIFAFLFGLSMDYEVFILARMREEYDKSGDTDQAVVAGLGRTGRLVTGAALILFLAFIALTSSPGTDIKVFATALGIGILLDATVVRALLVPSLVSLFGRWNWWLPAWAARVMRVEPHAAIPEPRRAARSRELESAPTTERRPGAVRSGVLDVLLEEGALLRADPAGSLRVQVVGHEHRGRRGEQRRPRRAPRSGSRTTRP